jgi:hypothetical protein
MRIRSVLAVAAATGTVAVAAVTPAQATEYSSDLKIKGVQYDAPGRDSNNCRTGNTRNEFLVPRQAMFARRGTRGCLQL